MTATTSAAMQGSSTASTTSSSVAPYDPSFKPKRRTATGRYKHEGTALRQTADGRIAVSSGDDARFEYVYKFVSKGSVSRTNRKANAD